MNLPFLYRCRAAQLPLLTCLALGLVACSSDKSSQNAPVGSKVVPLQAETDARPENLFKDCTGIDAGGRFSVNKNGESKDVTFFLERDGKSGVATNLQKLLATCDFRLERKEPHSGTLSRESGGSLWMTVAHADGSAPSLRVLNGVRYIVSDGVTDWHWMGGNPAMYEKIMAVLAPSGTEMHVESAPAVVPLPDASIGGEGAPSSLPPQPSEFPTLSQ